MLMVKMMLINNMTERVFDKVYLHYPTKIFNHSLSLYKVNSE